MGGEVVAWLEEGQEPGPRTWFRIVSLLVLPWGLRAACCQSLDLDHHPLEKHGRQGPSRDLWCAAALLRGAHIYCSQERWEPWTKISLELMEMD